MLEIYEDNAACDKFSLSMLYNNVNRLNVEKVDNNQKPYFQRSRTHFKEMKRCQLQRCTDEFSRIRPSRRKTNSRSSPKTIPNKILIPTFEKQPHNKTISIARIPSNKINFSYRRYAEENKMHKMVQQSSSNTLDDRSKFVFTDNIVPRERNRSSTYNIVCGNISIDAIRAEPVRRLSVVSIGTVSSDGSVLPPLEYKSSSDYELSDNDAMMDRAANQSEKVDETVGQCGQQIDVNNGQESEVKNHADKEEVACVENVNYAMMDETNSDTEEVEDSMTQANDPQIDVNIVNDQESEIENPCVQNEQLIDNTIIHDKKTKTEDYENVGQYVAQNYVFNMSNGEKPEEIFQTCHQDVYDENEQLSDFNETGIGFLIRSHKISLFIHCTTKNFFSL